LKPVRILIVDDLPSWRRFVGCLLLEQSKFKIVAEASDGLEAVQKSEALQPNLILLDVDLPHLDGLEAARRINAIAPGSRILFVSENQCPAVMREALRTGTCTRGYLLKSDAESDLLPALEAVVNGQKFVSRRLAELMLGNSADR
jgi:DNA-binding NarL/FixJ family response regulator